MPSPLIVVATREEAVHLPSGLPVVLTGIGKVNATLALTRALAGTRPSADASHEIAELLRRAIDVAAPFQVSQKDQLAGHLYRRPGRAQPMVPPHVIEAFDGTTLTGKGQDNALSVIRSMRIPPAIWR